MTMPATLTHSTERLTWPQIAERYPDTWVGLAETKFKNDDNINVETAIVYATGDKGEVFDCQLAGEADFVMFTSPEKNALSNWMLWRA